MRRAMILLALVALLLMASVGLAQDPVGPSPAGEYNLSWWAIGGGGEMHSPDGSYILSGAAGQPDAGGMAGGDYALAGGFWGGAAVAYHFYLPLVLKNS